LTTHLQQHKNQNWFHSTTTHRTSTDDIYIYGKQTLYDGVIESSNRKVGTLHPPKTFASICMRLQRKKLHSNTIMSLVINLVSVVVHKVSEP
jgi:hypothetical protein